MVEVVDLLQLFSQVPRVVLVQGVDQVGHPAPAALHVLIEFVGGRIAAPHLLSGMKFILSKEHQEARRALEEESQNCLGWKGP